MNVEDKKAIDKFKIDAEKIVLDGISQAGGLPPVLAVLTKHVVTDEYSAILTVAPDNSFSNEDSKDHLINNILPKLFNKLIKEDSKAPICFMFASEAWLTEVDINDIEDETLDKIKNDDVFTENFLNDLKNKRKNKVEVIIMSFENIEDNELIIKKIKREGMISNSRGVMVEGIVLEDYLNDDVKDKVKSSNGRFSKILKNFYKDFANIS
jgi:hypothetical protein